ARQAGIFEFTDEFSIRIEDLNSLVLPVGHPELAFGIERQSVRNIEFAGLFAFSAPRLDELSILIELEDARISVCTGRVSLRHEDIAIRSDRDIVRLVEKLRRLVPCAAVALGSEGHEDLPLRIEFHHRVGADVSSPQIAVLVDAQAVRPGKKA